MPSFLLIFFGIALGYAGLPMLLAKGSIVGYFVSVLALIMILKGILRVTDWIRQSL
jgi:hypothetical protein